jgi:hypothetical protein
MSCDRRSLSLPTAVWHEFHDRLARVLRKKFTVLSIHMTVWHRACCHFFGVKPLTQMAPRTTITNFAKTFLRPSRRVSCSPLQSTLGVQALRSGYKCAIGFCEDRVSQLLKGHKSIHLCPNLRPSENCEGPRAIDIRRLQTERKNFPNKT